MGRLNQAVCSNCPSNRFITFFGAVIDPATGKLRYTNAGHNLPLLVRATGETETLDTPGLVLGLFKSGTYAEASAEMRPGDLLVLFSDGVTEATDPAGVEYGEVRLAASCAALRHLPAREIVEQIQTAVQQFTQGAPAADDITLVVIRRTV
jgi:phosphoserine phosphatase RsbU/P